MNFKMLFLSLCLCIISTVVSADEKKMSIVCDIWPPYQISVDGHVDGFSTKVVKEVLKRMDVEIELLKDYPWKRALYMVEKSKADALFSANFTEDRTQFAYYPDEPIVQSPWVIWSREEDDFKFNTLNDLKNKKIGVVRGYSYTPEFLEFLKTHAKVDEVTDDATNFKKLNAARVDLTVSELGNGYHIIKNLKLDKIVPHTDHPIKTDGLYIIFNKESVSQAFVTQFSNELKKLKKESVYQIWHEEFFQ